MGEGKVSVQSFQDFFDPMDKQVGLKAVPGSSGWNMTVMWRVAIGFPYPLSCPEEKTEFRSGK
jgi:hypothetical protein